MKFLDPQIQTDTYLYFISEPDRRMVKIGLARDPESRLHALQAGSPVKLAIAGWLPNANKPLEDAVHCGFRSLWSHREWFHFGREIWDFYLEAEGGSLAAAVAAWQFERRLTYEDERGNSLSKYQWLSLNAESCLQ